MHTLSTLQELIHSLRASGDELCLLAMERKEATQWTYNDVADTVQHLANGLVQAGVKPGEYIPLLAKNRPEWFFVCLSIIYAGAAVVPLDTQIGTRALEEALNDCGARYVFTTTDYVSRLQNLSLELPIQPVLLDVDTDDKRGWHALLTDETIPLPTRAAGDPAAMFYTSGTTGTSKGVPLTHENLTFQLRSIVETRLLGPGDRVLMPLPMYHVYPFTVGLLAPLAFRVPIVLPHSIAGPHVIRAIQEGQVTMILGVPRLYRAIAQRIDAQSRSHGPVVLQIFQRSLALSLWLRRRNIRVGHLLFRSVQKQIGPSLRLLGSGGSALDPELAWKLEALGWRIAIGYGLTETSPLLSMNLPGSELPRLNSVGLPLNGVDIRIDTSAHPDGNDQQNDTDASGRSEGEIQARGPSVFAGYRNQPDRNAEAFTSDGWFRTGDLGYLDEVGNLYITGRVSTLIVTEGGKNIHPEPVEEIYQQNQFISEIGILQHDNRLVALVVPDMDEVNRWRNGDIARAIREGIDEQSRQLPRYQRIVHYEMTPEPLPRTNLGKIRRHLLAERYEQIIAGEGPTEVAAVGPLPIEEMSEHDRSLLEHPAARQVWELLANRWPDRRLTPDTNLRTDMGVDSLEWLNLSIDIGNETALELSEQTTRKIDTVRELLQAITTAEQKDTAPDPITIERPEDVLSAEQMRWLQPKGAVLTTMGVVGYAANKRFARGMFGVAVHGLDHLPQHGPFVLAPNHNSNIDPYVLAAALPYAVLRQTYWAGSIDMFYSNAAMRLFSRVGQVLPVAGAGTIDVRSSLAFALAALQREHNLIWFPEGRLSPNGELLPFRQGLGIVLHHYPVPVVPVYIQGTHQAMPRGQFIPRPHPVTVTIGQPHDPQELARRGEGDYPHARIVQALHTQMQGLIAV